MTLQDALKLAEANYPSIKAKTFNVDAYRSNMKLQKLDWMPRLDLNLQAVSSTLNNIYGLYYPQDIVLPIAGPVKTDNNYLLINSPYDGIITVRNLNIGDIIGNNSSKPIFEVENNRVVRIRVAVPEAMTGNELMSKEVNFGVCISGTSVHG